MADDSRQTDASDVPEGPVLVVGGAGYIGSHTVRALQQRGVSVAVFDNLSTGHSEVVSTEFSQGDLANREEIREALEAYRPRAVIHFAAKCYVGESVKQPSKYYRENVFNTWNLLEEMREAGCPEIVFSSTCATYGTPVEIPITEAHPQNPISPYGRTKLHIEHMLQDYTRAYGLRYAAPRYFNAAGAARDGSLGEDHDPETHLIPLVLQVALGQRDCIEVFGEDYDTPDGTCIRDYIHVEDLADAHLRALVRLQAGRPELVCNLGTGSGFSVLEVIETARRVTGREIAVREGSRRAGDPARLICGGTGARDLLGWAPRRTALEDIIGDAWGFLQRHPRGYSG